MWNIVIKILCAIFERPLSRIKVELKIQKQVSISTSTGHITFVSRL